METSETVIAKGQVVPSFINTETGYTMPWDQRHNTLSYDASKAIAGAFGGDMTVVPNRIGIVYGGADIELDAIDRDQTWEMLEYEMIEKDCDVQICTFSYSPTVAAVERDEETGYGVTFHTHTVSGRTGYRGTEFVKDSTIYHGVLLNYLNGKYKILARVDLKPATTSYRKKPENFEVALDWTVKFF